MEQLRFVFGLLEFASNCAVLEQYELIGESEDIVFDHSDKSIVLRVLEHLCEVDLGLMQEWEDVDGESLTQDCELLLLIVEGGRLDEWFDDGYLSNISLRVFGVVDVFDLVQV